MNVLLPLVTELNRVGVAAVRSNGDQMLVAKYAELIEELLDKAEQLGLLDEVQELIL